MNYAQQLINEGGPIIYILLGLLIISFALFLERYLFYYKSHIDTHEFLRGIFNIARNNKITEAVAICDSKSYPVSAVVRAVITHFDRGESTARHAANEAYMTELPKLRRGLRVLACLGNIAPILGLLGTLLSLMSIFDKISQEGHFVPTTELAGDVKSALLTTALGLIVAMAVHLFSFVLAQKLENIVGDMEKGCEEMINFCIVHEWHKQDKQDKTEPAHDVHKERVTANDRPARPSRQTDVENL
ncbi:MAG: MotA/TolQ/ExbB proton channel family protein [Victivallales bacterium]|nr:MotA/TolQ/ExbB proton channel family protein [Victivallales bacterium]